MRMNEIKLIRNRDQLRQNALVKQYYCDIDIAHLISYDEELAHKLTTEPADIIPLVRAHLKILNVANNVRSLKQHYNNVPSELFSLSSEASFSPPISSFYTLPHRIFRSVT